jgi:hypothetical protein
MENHMVTGETYSEYVERKENSIDLFEILAAATRPQLNEKAQKANQNVTAVMDDAIENLKQLLKK